MSPGSRKGGGGTGKPEALQAFLLYRSWESCEENLYPLVSISLSELTEPTVMILKNRAKLQLSSHQQTGTDGAVGADTHSLGLPLNAAFHEVVFQGCNRKVKRGSIWALICCVEQTGQKGLRTLLLLARARKFYPPGSSVLSGREGSLEDGGPEWSCG